jgi:hypothetical protein
MTASEAPVSVVSSPRAAPAERRPTAAPTLLAPLHRLARVPLGRWAFELADDLARCRRQTRTRRPFFRGVAEVANQTALILTYRGMPSMARTLCERQLTWLTRASRRAGDPGIAWHAVNPWANLGRLDALAGDWRSALQRYEPLRRYAIGRPLQLGRMRLCGPADVALGRSEPNLETLLTTVSVADSFKALLLARRFAEVDALASEVMHGAPRPVVVQLAEEATIVAACAVGDYASADDCARGASRRSSGWQQVVFQLRRAEVLACAGHPERAAALVARLVAVLRKVSLVRKSDPSVLQILARLSTFAGETGCDEVGAALALDAYEAARRVSDEGFQIEALRTMVLVTPPQQREPFAAALARLEQTTEYVRYRRRDQSLASNPVVDGLAARLLEIFGDRDGEPPA